MTLDRFLSVGSFVLKKNLIYTNIIINVAACSPESVAEFRSPDSVAECITSLTFLLLLVSPESVAEISGVDEAGGNVKAKHASKQQCLL